MIWGNTGASGYLGPWGSGLPRLDCNPNQTETTLLKHYLRSENSVKLAQTFCNKKYFIYAYTQHFSLIYRTIRCGNIISKISYLLIYLPIMYL